MTKQLNKSTAPKIRFPEFTDIEKGRNWEKNLPLKMGDI